MKIGKGRPLCWLILIHKWRTIPDGIDLIAREPNPRASGGASSSNLAPSTVPCGHEAFAENTFFPTQPGRFRSTPHAEMKTGDGAAGWIYAACRASRDGLGLHAQKPHKFDRGHLLARNVPALLRGGRFGVVRGLPGRIQ